MIELKGVSKTYKTGVPALRNINLTIRDGEFCFIVGKSGSGKTTLVRLLTKETDADEGSILVNDTDLRTLKRRHVPAYRRRLGVVFQDFRLLEDRTVYENIAFAQLIAGASDSEIFDNVTKILGLTGLSSKADSYPRQLSGGEQQRTAIARALINRPEILIADEPTGNLDHENAREVMKLLEKVNSQGTTVIVITHDREMVNRMHKRTVSMSLGEIVSDGFPKPLTAETSPKVKNAEDSSLLSFDWLKAPSAVLQDSPVHPKGAAALEDSAAFPESETSDSEAHRFPNASKEKAFENPAEPDDFLTEAKKPHVGISNFSGNSASYNYEDDWVEDWEEDVAGAEDDEEDWLDEDFPDDEFKDESPEVASQKSTSENSLSGHPEVITKDESGASENPKVESIHETAPEDTDSSDTAEPDMSSQPDAETVTDSDSIRTSSRKPYSKENHSSGNQTGSNRGLKGSHRPHHKAGKEDAK